METWGAPGHITTTCPTVVEQPQNIFLEQFLGEFLYALYICNNIFPLSSHSIAKMVIVIKYFSQQRASMKSVNRFGGVYLMVLSKLNVEYVLQEQRTKTMHSPNCGHLRSLIMLSVFPKSIFISYRSYYCSATRLPDKR